MEGDKTADNEKELTSTSTSSSDMSKLLPTNKEEKNDSNDTLPTSSTDASTSVKSIHLVSDDPISSTSSEMDITKSKIVEKASTSVSDNASTIETQVELEMSMATQRAEKIEENVDDLVSDLETLLGESTESFSLPFKASEVPAKIEVTSGVEGDSSSLDDKPDNEVSSNTDSSLVKNVNLPVPSPSASSEIDKNGDKPVQNELHHKNQELDCNGDSECIEGSSENDNTEVTQNLIISQDVAVAGDNDQAVKQASDISGDDVKIANDISHDDSDTNNLSEAREPVDGDEIIENASEANDVKLGENHDVTSKEPDESQNVEESSESNGALLENIRKEFSEGSTNLGSSEEISTLTESSEAVSEEVGISVKCNEESPKPLQDVEVGVVLDENQDTKENPELQTDSDSQKDLTENDEKLAKSEDQTVTQQEGEILVEETINLDVKKEDTELPQEVNEEVSTPDNKASQEENNTSVEKTETVVYSNNESISDEERKNKPMPDTALVDNKIDSMENDAIDYEENGASKELENSDNVQPSVTDAEEKPKDILKANISSDTKNDNICVEFVASVSDIVPEDKGQGNSDVKSTETANDNSVELTDSEQCQSEQSLNNDTEPKPSTSDSQQSMEVSKQEVGDSPKISKDENKAQSLESKPKETGSLEHVKYSCDTSTEGGTYKDQNNSESTNVEEIAEPCEKSQDIVEEIEISEPVDPSAVTDEGDVGLEPVIEEPQDNAQSVGEEVNTEIMELFEDESSLPVIAKDIEDNQKEQTTDGLREQSDSNTVLEEEEPLVVPRNVTQEPEEKTTSTESSNNITELTDDNQDLTEIINQERSDCIKGNKEIEKEEIPELVKDNILENIGDSLVGIRLPSEEQEIPANPTSSEEDNKNETPIREANVDASGNDEETVIVF